MPSTMQITAKHISGIEDGFKRMRLYGFVGDYIKGTMTRKIFVQIMKGHGLDTLTICSLLAELDDATR